MMSASQIRFGAAAINLRSSRFGAIGKSWRLSVVRTPRIRSLEAERLSVSQQLAAADDDKKVVTIHPAAIKTYLADVELMRLALEDDKAAERPELIEPLRRLIHSVVVLATPGVKGFEVEIKGRLHELIERPLLGGGRMVAREGLEPPTPGL